MALFSAAIGLLLLLAAGALALLRLRRVWGWRRAHAAVVGWESAWTERAVGRLIERRRVYFCRYRFCDAAGREHEFTSGEGSPVYFPDAVGVVLPVRYNPADPAQAVVWEFWPVWLGPLACALAALASLAVACWLW